MIRVNKNKRHLRLRKRLVGTSDRPRLSVFRSNKHIFAQIIDDSKAQTLVFASDMNLTKDTKVKKSHQVGLDLAKKAAVKKIKQVVFDRGGFLYHGRIMELAKGAREGGLEF